MLYRILVVDDEELITDSLAGMLAEAPQYELDVYKAYSGSEALELLNEQQLTSWYQLCAGRDSQESGWRRKYGNNGRSVM